MVEATRAHLRERFGDDATFEWGPDEFLAAGEFYEPLRQEECALVEYISPALRAREDLAPRLMSWAAQTFPAARRLLVRTEDRFAVLPGFEDYLYYMMLEAGPSSTETFDDISVRPAVEADREKVAGWLVMAFEDGLEMRPEPAPEGSAEAQSEAVLLSPEARSFVASYEGVDIGHVTLLVDQADDLTAQEYVELLDVLVDRGHPRRQAAEVALVKAAWDFSKEHGKPLLGHIVVRDKSCHCAGFEHNILDRLFMRGWTYIHKFEIATLDR